MYLGIGNASAFPTTVCPSTGTCTGTAIILLHVLTGTHNSTGKCPCVGSYAGYGTQNCACPSACIGIYIGTCNALVHDIH